MREDFRATTSNKQLAFVEHVKTPAQDQWPAAVVVPDNVLLEGEAGEIVRRKLLHECDGAALAAFEQLEAALSAGAAAGGEANG